MAENGMISIEETMLKELERKERLDNSFAYRMALPALFEAEEMGLSQERIKILFGFNILASDRKNLSLKNK